MTRVELLQAPASLHELNGQPVEQLRVRGRFALRCRGLRSCSQGRCRNTPARRGSRSPGRWSGPADRPASGRTTAASAAHPAGSGLRNAGTPGVNGLARLEEVAALRACACARLLARLENELCGTLGMLLPERLDPVVGVLPVGDGRPPVAEDGGDLRRVGARPEREDLAHRPWATGRPRHRARRSRRGESGRDCSSGCRRCSSRHDSAEIEG